MPFPSSWSEHAGEPRVLASASCVELIAVIERYPTTDPSRGLWGPKSPGSELSDLTITMTNVGDQGVDAVFGVIYPPQVALVSFGKPAQRVCAVDGAIHVMTTVLATLPADHGCSDDHRGALFFLSINELTRCAAVTG